MAGVSRLLKSSHPSRVSIWPTYTCTRACTAGLRPKPTCSDISALAHPRFTRCCWRSNGRAWSEGSQEPPAASNCSLIPNSCPSYF